MPRKKYGFGWKRDHKLSTLNNRWFTMRDNLIGRFIEILNNDGTYKRFEILEIEMYLPLHNSIVILGSPQLREPIGLPYSDVLNLLFEGDARFV